MRVFRDSQSGILIGLSLKVMYSFFARNKRFHHADDEMPSIFLARNPYDRCVSLFFDKCRARAVDGSFQACQCKMLKELGFSSSQQLTCLSFLDFCKLLEKIIKTDNHFLPQTETGVEANNFYAFRMAPRVIKIETGLPDLGKELCIDFEHRENATVHLPFQNYYCPESKRIVETLYANDFEVLDYEKTL